MTVNSYKEGKIMKPLSKPRSNQWKHKLKFHISASQHTIIVLIIKLYAKIQEQSQTI